MNWRGFWKGQMFLHTLKVGDIESGNYVEIDKDGVLKFIGTATIDDESTTANVFKSIKIEYDTSNYFTLTTGSTGTSKLAVVGSSDSFEIETGDGKIILNAGGDIDLDPAGNDINLLGAGAAKITLAATSMSIYGGDTTGDDLVLQANTADTDNSRITINGAGNIDNLVKDQDFLISYDGSNNVKIEVSSGGNATITPSGGNLTLVGQADLITIGLGGTVAEFTFPFNTVTNTEAAAAYCKVYDDGDAYYNLATSSSGAGYTANYQLFPDTEAENDAVFFGADNPFGIIYMDMSATVGVYNADSITWEYWDGDSWEALTIIYDQTDTTAQDGLRPFQQDGYIIFSAPSDWDSSDVDSQTAYWIRARCNATVDITTIPLTNSKEHQTISAAGGSEIPYDCVLSRARINWDTVSGANNDTKIVLHNVTTGESSAELTLTQALRENEITDLGMTVSANDTLVWFITQEDGTTEFADGTVEILATRA